MKPETNQPATQPSTINSGLPRCSHRTPAGRRCRAQARDTRSGLCPRHYFRPPDHQPDPELAADLLGSITEFQSASDVTDFLSRLLILQAQDRISPRRAAVMAYTCNLLLRSLRAMDLEALTAKAADDVPGQQVVWDLKRQPDDSTAAAAPTPDLHYNQPDIGRAG